MIVNEYLDSIERMCNSLLDTVHKLRKELYKEKYAKAPKSERDLTEPCANCGCLRGTHPVRPNGSEFHGCNNFIPSWE